MSNTKATKYHLTEGPIVPNLIKFSLPMILSMLIQQLYNVADTVIVGQFVGSDAIAAVGASFSIMMLFNSLFMGIATGAGIIVAQYFGARRDDMVRKAVSTSFTIAYIIGIVLSVFGFFLSGPMLELLGTPENIIKDSTTYLAIVYAGMLGNIAYNMGGGILRGMGDSKWPLIFVAISAATNVVLDLVFVVFFEMGVAGVAIATTISHFLSGILVHVRINSGKYPCHFSPKTVMLDKQLTKQIFKLGIPSALQSAAMSFGSVIIQSFANKFGSNFIAANSIVMKIDGFAVMPMMAYGMAVSTFVGQNIGARKVDRASKGIRSSMILVICFALVMGVFLWIFGGSVMHIFTDEQAVLDIGFKGIRILAFFYSIMGLNHCMTGAMRGAGSAAVPMIAQIAGTATRIPVAYFLAVVPMDHYGLFWSMAISMCVPQIISQIYYNSGKWKNKGLVSAEEQGK